MPDNEESMAIVPFIEQENAVLSDPARRVKEIQSKFDSFVEKEDPATYKPSFFKRQDGYKVESYQLNHINTWKKEIIDIVKNNKDDMPDDLKNLVAGDGAVGIIKFNSRNNRLLQKDRTGTEKTIAKLLKTDQVSCSPWG